MGVRARDDFAEFSYFARTGVFQAAEKRKESSAAGFLMHLNNPTHRSNCQREFNMKIKTKQ